jgi:hypothetical protein
VSSPHTFKKNDMRRDYLLILLLLVLIGASCKWRAKDGINWDQNLVAPIVKSRIGLEDAIQNSSFVHTNPDNSITVVFRDTLVQLKLEDYLVVPDTSYAAKITLDSITLATDTLNQDITMGQILRQLCAQGNNAACILLTQHGQTLLFGTPAFNNISAPEVPIDASQFFDEADLLSGFIEVQVENHLPMTLARVQFYLRNAGLRTDTLVHTTMLNIAPGTTQTVTESLAGKTVESAMAAGLEDIDVGAAPGGTVLDTNDYIRLKIIVRDLHASRATAVFPAQRVIDDYSRINYRFDNGVEITKIKSKTGHLVLDAISTLQDTIAFVYSLPTAIKNGQPVVIHDRLIPNINGSSTAHIDFELADYFIDMTLNGDSVNLFPYRLVGDLLYSGIKHTMDLQDSIDISYGLQGIKPSYIEGYLGTSTFNFADTINFSFFSSILGGTLDLRNPAVTMTINNSIGVDGELHVRQMDAVNRRTNQTIPLTGTLMSQPTEVRGPRLPNVGQTVSTPIVLNQSNSNIRQFISSLPDEIRFNMDVLVNKNGNPALRNNFATDLSAISAYLDIEVPFEGITDRLWLQDTLAINVTDASLPKGIESGKLKLVGSNQFPFEAEVQVLFVDAQGAIFDSLFTGGPQTLPAGQMNPSGYVDIPGTGELVAQWDQIRFTTLKQRGAKAITRFVLSTKPNGQHVKLYTTYGIDFYLVGDVNYHVGN